MGSVVATVAVDKIPADPNALVALMAFVYSVLVTAANWLFYKSNLREERTYRREFALYELLVLAGCQQIIDFTTAARAQFDSLMKVCMRDQLDKKGLRNHVERCIEHIDSTRSNLESNVVAVMSGYSADLGADLLNLVESYDDKLATLFAEFDRKAPGPRAVSKHTAAFNAHTETFLRDAFCKIRNSCPTVK